MAIQAQPEAPTASPAPTEQSNQLTPDMVCDLPMGELLARVNGRLDTIDTEAHRYEGIDTTRFLGYVVDRRLSGITVYTPANATEAARDISIRYLVTQYLGLPTDLFPDIFEVTVYTGADVEAVLS
ncbi:hypothetical protein AB0I77_29505 [Streptomyces sp. NPDC050619]|uniref:hypothetical protein n=1 Tax=Streptomyces sp. NPDC050619 TaxID=3157214 RepID=UPI0034133363